MVIAKEPTFFVNGALLGNFQDKRVKIIARFENQNGNQLHLKTSDDMQITVNCNRPVQTGPIVELEGHVRSPNMLDLLSDVQVVPDNFDMKNYNEMVALAHGKARSVFT